jgi:hypothetical protein
MRDPSIWNALPSSTQKNLKLYSGTWILPEKADGRVAIHRLLNDINDIFRVCNRFALNFDVGGALGVWPTIYVEFSSLPDNNNVDFEVRISCTLLFSLIYLTSQNYSSLTYRYVFRDFVLPTPLITIQGLWRGLESRR